MTHRDDHPAPQAPSDEIDAGALEAAGIDPVAIQQVLASLSSGGAAPTQGVSLTEMLMQSSMAVTGRSQFTPRGFSGVLPPWAADLAPAVLQHPDFDPYFGITSLEGDERVYMGAKKVKPEKKAGADQIDMSTLVDPLVTGRPNSDDGIENPRPDLSQPAPAPALPSWLMPGNAPDAKGPKKPEVANPDDRTLTAAQVKNLPYTWSEEKITSVMKLMRESGINVTTFEQMGQAWGNLVNRASMIYSMSEGKNKVTPWDVLDMYKSEAKAAGTLTDFENGSKTTVNRSVANITEGEAWASLQQTVSQMLGHDPSDQEVRDFAYKMNQLAAENPAITKTITKYRAGEATSSSSSTEGGFSAADMAKSAYEKAQGDPDYAEYQASTVYYNAALSALGAIGDGG